MKNLLIIVLCCILFACSGSDDPSEDPHPDYTTVKQQLPLKLSTWADYINAKEFTSAKTIVVTSGSFWDKTLEAQNSIGDSKQITYNFFTITLNENSFSPQNGTASITGTVKISLGTLKIVEEKNYTATLICEGDAQIITNWKLKDLYLP